MTSQPLSYRDWVAQVAELAAAVRKIDALGQEMGLPPAEQAEWHGNLFQKLLPQLAVEPFLVVAVTGGTNTGKSAVFNHLVGSRTSLVDPNATQTRHPVCSVAQIVSGRASRGFGPRVLPISNCGPGDRSGMPLTTGRRIR